MLIFLVKIFNPDLSCSYKDCDYPERRSKVRQCQSDQSECPGDSITYDGCPRNCDGVRDMCCTDIVLNDTTDDSGISGTFVFDQMLYDYPVFRHSDFVDTFIYRTNNEWRIGKGLFGNAVLYKSGTLNVTNEQVAICPTFKG